MRRVHKTDRDQLVVYEDGERTLYDNFRRFNRENPKVYRLLVRLAREWREVMPNNQVGMRLLFERARWEYAVDTRGEPLRLNNNYAPFYARRIMKREPDLDGAFEIRRQRRGRKR